MFGFVRFCCRFCVFLDRFAFVAVATLDTLTTVFIAREAVFVCALSSVVRIATRVEFGTVNSTGFRTSPEVNTAFFCVVGADCFIAQTARAIFRLVHWRFLSFNAFFTRFPAVTTARR